MPHRKDACSPTVSDIRRSFRSLRIRQYKGLEDVSLDEMGSFNLLVGANDVGKTSVLEAIFLLTGLSNIRLPGVVQAMRQLDPVSFGVIESIFRNLDTGSTIEISASMRDCDEFRDLKISTGSTNGGIQIGSTPMSQRHARAGGQPYSPALSGSSAAFTSMPAAPERLQYEVRVAGKNGQKPVNAVAELDYSSSEGIRYSS
ncbi:MAG: AAA family ATPase [Bacteroidota bacterium]|nr:AAA family ATPase [Bacteroidota bacterium]